MDVTIATEIAYKNGYAACQKKMLEELQNIFDNLNKICDAASDGVITQYDENGNKIKEIPYTMSNNAFNDVCRVWQDIHGILSANGIKVL